MSASFDTAPKRNLVGTIVFGVAALVGLICLIMHAYMAGKTIYTGESGYFMYAIVTLCTVISCVLPICGSMGKAAIKWGTVGSAALGEILALVVIGLKFKGTVSGDNFKCFWVEIIVNMILLLLPLLAAFLSKPLAVIVPVPEE